MCVPFGALKCKTFPSSWNILTSSIPGMACTLSFLRATCSFLSSWAAAAPLFLTTFRLGVPFPPTAGRDEEFACKVSARFLCHNWRGKARTQADSRGRRVWHWLCARTDSVLRALGLEFGQLFCVHGGACGGRENAAVACNEILCLPLFLTLVDSAPLLIHGPTASPTPPYRLSLSVHV